jgi:5-methylcytosine-specific restriction protein A
MARKPQYSGPWKKVRLQVLERDGNRCQIRGQGCTDTATEVDHILPVSMGGAWYDEDNLRASCSRCNNARNVKKTLTASRAW